MALSDRFHVRRQQLRKALKARKLEGLLVTSETNVRWLTGFTGDSTWLLVTQDSEQLLSDFRFDIQLSEECAGVAVTIRGLSQSLPAATAEQITRLRIETLGFESHSLTVDLAERLAETCSHASFVAAPRIVEELRAIKDSGEIAELRAAIQIAERGFEALKATLTKSKTEAHVAAEMEFTLRQLGAQGFSFPAIIAVGDRAALPHYRAGSRLIGDSPILLIDWGARLVSGYCSDLTRTVLTGRADRQFERVYKTVLAAQQAAIEQIAPGKTCGEIDQAARQVIEQAGFGKHFNHGLGHGIGLDVHELPRLGRESETVLKPGMVVTVEPGIYLPGWGGVRIEDDVLVTRRGSEVLSSAPKDWETVRVDC